MTALVASVAVEYLLSLELLAGTMRGTGNDPHVRGA